MVQVIVFCIGLGLLGSGGLGLIICVLMTPVSGLPKEILRASTWVVVKRYFLGPLVCMGVGAVCVVIAIVSAVFVGV